MLDTGCWILDAGWAESSKLKAESSEMEGVGCQDMKVSGVRCRVSGYEGVGCQVSGVGCLDIKVSGVRCQGFRIQVARFRADTGVMDTDARCRIQDTRAWAFGTPDAGFWQLSTTEYPIPDEELTGKPANRQTG
ncbi:hypothetical protein D3OALGB2SA_5686 [Olavius algarvensis associated proteobacterium Delta 3]|nr:hypothetical protein D3OALGB2SA_5686 [Olavius algarvensis associated proteobacterium Delta 3]